MYALINANIEAILRGLDEKRDMRDYQELQSLVTRTDTSTDLDFQSKFRSYWRFDAALLSREYRRRFFGILEQSKHGGSPDIGDITRRLYAVPSYSNGRQSLQFSFASKLVHSIDPSQPIYDSFIAAFYFFIPPASSQPFEKRLESLLSFQAFLRSEYERILHLGLLDPALSAFRERFGSANALTPVRIIDLLLWSVVNRLRQRVQQAGELLYE